MPIFYLTIQPTFYERGFFNVTVDFDRFVRREEGPVTLTLKLGLKSENIEGRIERKSNTNGTARIHGNKSLRDWFKRNFKRYDVIAVDLSSREIIILDGQAGEKSSSTPQSVKTDVLSKATPQETNVFVSFKMKSLVNIGFRKVGEWKMLGESISPNILTSRMPQTYCMHSFQMAKFYMLERRPRNCRSGYMDIKSQARPKKRISKSIRY